MSKTATVVVAPILKALIEVENYASGVDFWRANNEQQRIFLKSFYPHRQELERFSNKELKAWASTNAEELNRILQ